MRKLFVLTVSAVLLTIAAVQANAATFAYPKWNGYALDWCKNFEGQCGKPAADLWCQKKGFPQAVAFTKLYRVSFQTMTVGNNAVCDPRSHHCDSFQSITCQDLPVVTIVQPRYNGYRLDWCQTFGTNCGAPAADLYCRKLGYAGLHSFAFQGPITQQTMTVGNNAVCDPRFHRCDSFGWVRCRR